MRVRNLSPIVFTVSLALLGAGCSTDSGTAKKEQTALQAMGFTNATDLSHVIDANIPIWPGDPTPELTDIATIDKDGFYLRKFTIGEHSATHMNAGNSFFAGGTSIDSYQTEKLIKRAVVIDVAAQATQNPDYALTRADVERWEKENGRVPNDAMVLVHTGWQNKWNDPKAFFNEDAKGNKHFPGIAESTAKWLLKERKIAGVGIDTHGADPGLDTSYATNNAVLKAKGIVLECITNLDKLPATGSTLVIAPLRLRDGSGTPLSVVALS